MNVAHFRAIHWISCSSYILALILGLCAVLLFWEGLERGRRGWILGSSLLLAAAVFAHASTVAIPLFCFFLAVRRTSSIQKAIYIALPQLATVAVCSIVVLAAYPNTFQAAAIVRAPQPFDMVRNLIWFWSRLASTAHWLPGFLDLEGVTHWELGAGFLFLIGSLYLSVLRGPDPCLLTWTVWSILFCLPFINSASLMGNIPGPSRYLYFASLGTSFILAWTLHAIVFRLLNLSRAGERAAFLGVLSLIVVLSHFGLARAEAISLYHAGRRYIARGDHAPGVNQLKAAIARSTNILPIDVYSRLAMSSFVLGKSSESILRSALLKHPDLHELNMLLGMSALLQSDPQVREAGERQVRDAVESSVDKELLRWYAAIAYNNLATFYSGSGHKRTAIELYFNAIRSYPDYPTAICNLGRVLYDSGDRKRAADVVHSLLQLQLPDGFIMRNATWLGDFMSSEGRKEDAAAFYKLSASVSPEDGSAHHTLAITLAELERFEEAIEAYHSCLRYQPDNLKARLGLVTSYERLNRIGELIATYRHAASLKQDSSSFHNLAITLKQSGRLKEAIQAYNAYLKFQPDNWRAQLSLAQAHESLDEIDEAILAYQKGLSLNPHFVEAHFNLGVHYFKRGEFDEAAESFSQAVRLSPDSLNARIGLAQSFERMGQREEAVREYRNALLLNPNDRKLMASLQALLAHE